MTLWHGRFSESMSESLWRLSESYSFDHLLYRYDITGSRAHVRGLVAAGLLDDDEGEQILLALDQVEEEFDRGLFTRQPTDEDVHMAIERRVTEIAGAVGAKLHTGRSRNDQVATTVRLFTRDALTDLASRTLDLATTLVATAERFPGAYLPGYTHFQRAQPVLLAHHLGAHAWSLARDVDRLIATRERASVSPLGAGAIAGSSLPLDPAFTARELGFARPFENSMDAVSDRDFIAETLFDIALLGTHLSRMGEELVLWTTAEFGFAALGDAYTTGSSMLPQKKNSDVAELARGKAGRFIGNLTTLLVVLKGLPLTYNRDLQEDKEPLFDSVEQAMTVLDALRGAYRSLEFRVDVAREAADDASLAAIDVAEELVRRGVPFRRAHELVGEAVGESMRSGRPFLEVLSGRAELADAAEVVRDGSALERRRSPGASGPLAQPAQGAAWSSRVAELRARLTAGEA